MIQEHLDEKTISLCWYEQCIMYARFTFYLHFIRLEGAHGKYFFFLRGRTENTCFMQKKKKVLIMK